MTPFLLGCGGYLVAEEARETDHPPAKPLCLNPDNPHYFLFRGSPTVLIASGEHYGSVINPDFDYRTYLDTLRKEGGNLTRAVARTMCESQV